MSKEVRIVRLPYPTTGRVFPTLPTPESNSYFYGVVRLKTVAHGVLTPSDVFTPGENCVALVDDYHGVWVHFEDRESSRYAKHLLWSDIEWFELREFPRDEVENPDPPPGYCQLQDVHVGESFYLSGACGKEIEGIVLKKGYMLPDSVARSDDRTKSYVLLLNSGKVHTFPISTLVRKRPYPT